MQKAFQPFPNPPNMEDKPGPLSPRPHPLGGPPPPLGYAPAVMSVKIRGFFEILFFFILVDKGVVSSR